MPRYIVNAIRHHGPWGSLYCDFQVVDTHTDDIVAEGLKHGPAHDMARDLNRKHRKESN